MARILYSGSDSEQKALGQFCSNGAGKNRDRDKDKVNDRLDSFWPYEEFLLSLKIPQTFLLYDEAKDPRSGESLESSEWNGFAIGRVIGGVAELFYIFTNPQVRGRGLGAELLREFEAHAQSRYQAESAMLEVRVSNAAAIRLYERFGYARIHQRKKYYKDGEDALIFTKALEGAEGAI